MQTKVYVPMRQVSATHSGSTQRSKFLVFVLLFLAMLFLSMPAQAQRRRGGATSLAGRVYYGTIKAGDLSKVATMTMRVHFKSKNVLVVSVQGTLDGGEVVDELIAREGFDIREPHVEKRIYTVKNGEVRVKGSTDKWYIRKGGKQLYWYVSDNFCGMLDRQK